MRTDYRPDWFYWVYHPDQPQTKLALLCGKPEGDRYHLHLLIVRPEFRSQGWARRIMTALHRQARKRGYSSVTLSCLKVNKVALRLYRRLGYQIGATEQHAYLLAKQLCRPPAG